jgi:ABC-type sugar transport system substrate-binding protein
MPKANRTPILKVNQTGHLPPRLGVATIPNDPYWVQVREAVYRGVQQCGAELVPLEMVGSLQATTTLDSSTLAEEILAQSLDALICVDLPPGVVERLLASQLPVIQLAETEEIHHSLFTSPSGLYECGRLAGEYIARRLGDRGRTLCVGGLLDIGCDKGKSRIQGFADVLRPFPDISVLHCATYWDVTRAYPQIEAVLRNWGPPIDAIFGISDPLALVLLLL